MYRKLDSLLFVDEESKRDPQRIRAVARARNHAPWFVTGGFALAGGGAASFAILIAVALGKQAPLPAAIGATMCALLSLSLFWAAWLFWQERKLDPLRGFLQNPKDYGFYEGTLQEATYHGGSNRSTDRILVEGSVVVRGKTFPLFETFSPRAWPFADKREEKSLKPGDDWYDQKGKRPKLPIPVTVLVNQNDPARCALIGIHHEILSPSTEKTRIRRQ